MNLKATVMAIATLGIGLWLWILHSKGIAPLFTVDAVKEIPSAAGYVSVIVVVFGKWGWRSRIFQKWFVLVPDLNGTWKGYIRSSYINPHTNAPRPAKIAYLVVKQSLFKINCILLTNESKSKSHAASITLNAAEQVRSLSFTYTNTPKVLNQGINMVHDGAAVIDIVMKPDRRLEGKYWTDRSPIQTKGEMNFTFHSRVPKETFS